MAAIKIIIIIMSVHIDRISYTFHVKLFQRHFLCKHFSNTFRVVSIALSVLFQ